jgi:flagellar basal body-associated protein FliL
MIASIVIFANKERTKGEFQKQMKNLKWIIGLVILVIVGYTIFNGSESAPKQDNAAYTQQLQKARKEKDEFFKTGKESLSKTKLLSKDYRILK